MHRTHDARGSAGGGLGRACRRLRRHLARSDLRASRGAGARLGRRSRNARWRSSPSISRSTGSPPSRRHRSRAGPSAAWFGRRTTERYAAEYLAAHAALCRGGVRALRGVQRGAGPAGAPGTTPPTGAGRPYLGLGPSAHSAAGGERWWNLRDWTAYERAIAEGREWVAGREAPDPASARLEELYLGLRTAGRRAGRAGAGARRRRHGCGAAGPGWPAGAVRLTVEGWLRLDALVAAV